MGRGAEQAVFDTIDPAKDVDGFGAASVGLLVQNRPKLVACTPSGVIELLQRENIQIAGRHAVVIGRSDIVGKPMAMLLLHRDATVTICHSKTPNLAEVCRQADILVAAVGRPGLVTRDFVKPAPRSSTSESTGSPIQRWPHASIRPGIAGSCCSSRRARCWSATCILRSKTSPER
jgi:5,10-methylene-tetrahydrofolate dehydrogenase/methenyl tetrahydrofolate cyclohydrolase